MNCYLNKDDLINLVTSIVPINDELQEKMNVSFPPPPCFSKVVWRWQHTRLHSLTEEELYDLYVTIKNQWEQIGFLPRRS